MLAGGAFYTALVVATQIDHIFFPGTELHIGGPVGGLPLVDSKGTSSGTGDIGGGRINILVMGLDRRPQEGDAPARTDTMFIVTIDPSTKTVRGLAMPRDLWVDIPTKSGNSTFKERINAAYVYGETQDYPGGGAKLAETTVERLTGIKINYYVIVDFSGFKQVIDLLGGIDVDVEPPGLNDPYYSETEKPGDYYPCVFSAGVHHMDSSDALCFARSRNFSAGGDFDRILRQQRIIFAVMDKATQLHVLADPGNVVNLWKRYKDTVSTDINDLQVPGFARLAAAMDPNQLAFLSMAPCATPFTTSDGAAVLLPGKDCINQLVTAFMADNTLIAEAATVEVQNGTGIKDQASKASDYFTSLGIPSASIQTADAADFNHDRTEIIDFGGKPYTAQQIASWLGLSKDIVRKATAADTATRTTNSDIVVILGNDAKLENALGNATP